MGRHEQLPPWAVTSNCRHRPSRAIPLRTCRGLRSAEEKGQPGWRRAFECFDRRPDIACTTGSCFGRSRNSRTMSSAAAPEKQPPQHEFPLLRGRASAGNCGPRRGTELFSGAEFNFPHRAERPAGLRLQRLGRDEEDERTFGLHGEMDEFRRLKVMYPTVPNCLPSRICRIPGFCQGGVSASGRWAWQRGPW